MDDVPDMEAAVEAAFHGIFSNMGEVCNAGSRLLVDRSIHDAFVEKFIAAGRHAYSPGDPLDPATNMGPLVTAEAQERVLGYIEAGKAGRSLPRVRRRHPWRRSGGGRLRQPDALHRRRQRHEDRPRGDLRTGRLRDSRRRDRGSHRGGQRHGLRDWPRASGRATSTPRCAWSATSRPASSGSTASTRAT